ncbi:PREDICTED: uncharacterized protein LOC104809923 [Tarenaya hassleriana]|uniref:uncharacterized protein LOC104809923 n=1 Tax=Tarenaya hassleriana TaxID=28532 RepID=UPI00053CA7B7|nr:PREDICTED: uncharacterized protein LOC104809923 [Tarenaya hassleriana]
MKRISTWNARTILVVAAVIWAAAAAKRGGAELSAAECREERRVGINACKSVLYGRMPSPACCERVRDSHVECVCPVITPKLAALVDIPRAIRLIEGCGRKVPRHFTCGSITTP